MSSSFLEIVRLANGEVVLQRANGDGEPLVRLSFSDEAKVLINDACLDVGKVMIHAGIHAAASVAGLELLEASGDETVLEGFVSAQSIEIELDEDGSDDKSLGNKTRVRVLH